MDSHPKVMTVSYGTFSCTLDGFDDPFTTMQLVAEYFRKLSADDRYFGSEPLQPDASKLHQIAESANPNRIDAEVSENSVILRQADVIDVPSRVNNIETREPEHTAEQNLSEKDAPDSAHTEAAFSSRRLAQAEDELVVEAEPVVQAKEELAAEVSDAISDALTASLEKNVNDTTTADELAPTLEEEISSETVSAAVKALKSGEEIDRWLETTNQKMSTPEHVSKANALERLKAAVAATEAERAIRMENITSDIVIETGEERRDNTISFRRELSKVRKAYEQEARVFSRPKARSAANGASRPLVLDMGQRIDRITQDEDIAKHVEFKKKSGLTLVSDKGTTKRGPKVTIKRKPASELPSFDEFSKLMGASTLTELLEASAAYMALVHVKDHYSGDQITANLPDHIKRIVKTNECTGALDRLSKRGFLDERKDGNYTISMARKAAYQKKYLAG